MIGSTARRRPAVMQRGVSQRRHRPDYVLLVLSAVLLVVGLVVIYSISPGLAIQRHVSDNYYVVKQLIAIFLGMVTFAIMATVPYDLWRKLQKPLIGAALLATVIALAMPVSEQYPAHRWIRLGGLSFQSVELIKFSVIFVFAAFLVDRIKRGEVADKDKALKPIGIAFAIMAVMIAGLQSDLGSTGVIIAMIGAMWFVAGLPTKYILLGIGGVALVLLLAISTSGYRRDRMLTFLHPERDCSAAGYQACQALIAVGSGGLFGKGLGHGAQAYGYVPEAANDSIFSILAEKFGFVGVTALLCVFWAFFTRLKNIMERAPDDFSRLVVAGILAWLSTQAIINIGAMIGLLPLKGITLPLISYGGTSIIFVTAAIGLVYNISRYTTYGVNEGASESRLPVQTNRRYSVVTPTRR
jgi:cell division protein FtsW